MDFDKEMESLKMTEFNNNFFTRKWWNKTVDSLKGFIKTLVSENSTPVSASTAPQLYSLVRGMAEYAGNNPHLQWSITGYDTIYGGNPGLGLDVDLSNGNYWGIHIEGPINTLTLPTVNKNSLRSLVLSAARPQTSVPITLSDYPNLGWVVLQANYNGIIDANGYFTYEPCFVIQDVLISLEKMGALWLGGNDYSLSTEFTASPTFTVYGPVTLGLASRSLENVELDFTNITWWYNQENGKYRYDHYFYITASQNLTNIFVGNLSPIADIDVSSKFIFDFRSNNLTQASVDLILETINAAIPDNTTNNPRILLQNSSNDSERGDYITSGNGHSFVIGQKYVIESLGGGDDFANIGYVSDGVEFTASGTTPTLWNSTTVYFGSNFGIEKSIEFVSANFTIPDGTFVINTDTNAYGISVDGGVIDTIQHLSTNALRNSSYVGKQVTVPAYMFEKQINLNKTEYLVPYTGVEEIIFEVTAIHKNAMPTGGTSNQDYIDLLAKGWDVKIAY